MRAREVQGVAGGVRWGIDISELWITGSMGEQYRTTEGYLGKIGESFVRKGSRLVESCCTGALERGHCSTREHTDVLTNPE